MNEKHPESFCEDEGALYKIVDAPDFYRAFRLTSTGGLVEVSAGRLLAVGIPVSREEFQKEMEKAKRESAALPSNTTDSKACGLRGVASGMNKPRLP